MSDTAIKVSRLKKSYRYYRSNMQKIQNLLFGIDAGDRTEVLKGVSFEIKKGERVGIISTPMSGRSTLMQIMAGVLTPDSGSVEIDGEMTAILDHKLGFEAALSGRVNYITRCKLMGWTDEMIKEHEESIFKRADIDEALIDEPVKNYRRGSANRIGFAIATELTPEILLYDETFSFGGKKYITRSVSRLNKITKGEDTTFVLIVNDTKRAAKLCERGIVLHKGRVVFDGTYEDAVLYYSEHLKPAPKKTEGAEPETADTEADVMDTETEAAEKTDEIREMSATDQDAREGANNEIEEFSNRDTYDESENEKEDEESDDYQP